MIIRLLPRRPAAGGRKETPRAMTHCGCAPVRWDTGPEYFSRRMESAVNNDNNSARLRGLLESESSDAREIIGCLFDEGTFAELGGFVRRELTETDRLFGGGESDFEPVITGYGSVNGKLTYAFVQDASRMKGALTSAHAKKICDLMYKALGRGAPVIGVFASNGAVVTEGVAALSGYGQIIRAASDCKGRIPLIAVIDGVCASAAAAAAGIFDFTVITDKGSVYVVPPFLLKARFGDTESGTAKAAYERGAADMICPDRAGAAEAARKLISLLPSSADDDAVDVTGDDINRLTPEIADMDPASLDVKDVIKTIADNGCFIELRSGFSPEIVTGLAVLNGRTVGVAANQPSLGGRITPSGADKAAELIDFCDSFGLPLLTLTDVPGFDLSDDSEKSGFASALARLGYAYATSSSPKVTAVIGPSYGGGYVLMGSKALGADICLALEGASIAPLSPDAAAELLRGDKPKDELKRLYAENVSSPLCAARYGEIDEIVVPEELRQRIISAFETLCD